MDYQLYQKTIQASVSCEGVGLHSGKVVHLTLHPAAINEGIVFVRKDLKDITVSPRIPALYDLVVDTQLCTRLENVDGVSIATVEHLMSALWACGIDNVVVEVDAPEIPILDGSAQTFLDMIDHIGVCVQNEFKNLIVVEKTVEYRDNKGGYARISPVDEIALYADVAVDYGDDVIGAQMLSVKLTEDLFKKDIGKARTFGFLKEAEYLWSKGLALGASLDNTVVIDEGNVLNEGGLRFDNEFVRHKILDFCGDISLIPGRLVGRFSGFKAGHGLHNQMLRKLFSDKSQYAIVPADQFEALYCKKEVA